MIEDVIAKWHANMRGQLPGGLDELLDDDVVFYSPIVFTPQAGKAITKLYLQAAGQTLPGEARDESSASASSAFHYTKEVLAGDTAVLEFETTRRRQVRQRRRHHPVQRAGPHRRDPRHAPATPGDQPRASADGGRVGAHADPELIARTARSLSLLASCARMRHTIFSPGRASSNGLEVRMRRSARPIVIIATLLALAAIAAPAGAAPDPEVGRDISYPQCASGSPHRHEASYAVLGVNGGRAFTENPCLVAQLRWAKRLPGAPAFYANTGNPGPKLAKHWPLGQATPYVCSASDPEFARLFVRLRVECGAAFVRRRGACRAAAPSRLRGGSAPACRERRLVARRRDLEQLADPDPRAHAFRATPRQRRTRRRGQRVCGGSVCSGSGSTRRATSGRRSPAGAQSRRAGSGHSRSGWPDSKVVTAQLRAARRRASPAARC